MNPHILHMTWDRGTWFVSVDCPDESMGAERPCAAWKDYDGADRLDQCTFQQYADDADTDEWLHGTIEFPPIEIVEGGSGEDWHAVVKDTK